MAASITPPAPGADVRELYRVVAELVDVVNALKNMTVLVEGKDRMIGRLVMQNGAALLILHEHTEVGSQGT